MQSPKPLRKHRIETPRGWHLLAEREDGYAFQHSTTLQRVILSWCIEDDGREWAHLSTSFQHRLPRWPELVEAKETFLGDVLAVQVLPPRAEYVNANPYVLHLFACLDGRPLPDFRGPDGAI